MKERLIVAPHGGAWEVRPEKSKRFTSLHRSKELAVTAADHEAKRKHTTVIVKPAQKN